ncbi:hypothetical protein HMPREF0201_02112 [Cedecea davisae DSM 4568]|uniref:Uncharacterized protein n=1 Tax=Cedecea davisae DSM 4568 TaxID=566551 RepID=S3J9S5_9ENTR|nr:hypothetical protein HMPREF0201_02112 [Cedecea davisae DSM 4568]
MHCSTPIKALDGQRLRLYLSQLTTTRSFVVNFIYRHFTPADCIPGVKSLHYLD